MDGSQLDPSRYKQPGAPELGKAAKIPEAPPAEPVRADGPVFQPEANPAVIDRPSQPPAAAEPAPEEELDEHQARLEYLRSVRQRRAKPSHKLRNSLLIIILVLLVAAGAGYWYWQQHAATPVAKTNRHAQPAKTEANNQTPPGTFTKQTKTYSATDFGLTLQYPADWTPNEQNGIVTITSPNSTLTTADGKTTTGLVVLSIRPKQPNPPELKDGNAVAVLDSKIIKYTSPAAGQRGSTYLSFLQYASTTTKGGLDGVYVTGNYGYQYAQVIPKAAITGVDPLIDVTFVSCGDVACAQSSQSPLAISSKSWTGDLSDTVETMLKSFTFE